MSLSTDLIFVSALRSSSELTGMLPAGDVYNTAIALPDEDADNAPLPYVIVSFDGLEPDATTKDTAFDSVTDIVHVGIAMAAKTRPQLAELAGLVRRAVRDYLQGLSRADYDLAPLDVSLSASAVQYDALKPCYWQMLRYRCDVPND